MGDIGFGELILIGIIAILLYGKDLPQVARKAAQFYSKIRRHLNDIKDEISRQIPAEELNLDASASPPSPYAYGGAPPPPPTGLTARLEGSQVVLSWDIDPQAEFYNVKRSTPPEGSYSTLATGLSSTTYTDNPTFDGSNVSYMVSATNSAGESGDSVEASVYLPGLSSGPEAAPAPPEADAPAPAAPPEDKGNGDPAAASAPPSPPSAEPEVPRMS